MANNGKEGVMRVKLHVTALPVMLFGAVAGCASSGSLEDELSNEATADPQIATTNYAYFSIMSDLRKCAYPTCGGWLLQRINQSATTCSDGTSATTCYTPVLDWSRANLPDAQRTELLDECRQHAGSSGTYAIVRGTFRRFNDTTSRPELGRFVITEAWLAEGDAESSGTFVNVKDNGIRCVTAPCPSFTETALNRRATTDIADVDF